MIFGGIPRRQRGFVVQAIDLLNQAVARDPSFLEAYCKLAFAHDQLYFFELDHTLARLALAEAAIQEAFRIRPNAGEAHLARGSHLYNGYLDYDGALAELEVATPDSAQSCPDISTDGLYPETPGTLGRVHAKPRAGS